jgi:1-pyrroline-5-carboxylate dehydrogenase
MGPVANASAYHNYQRYSERLRHNGAHLICGAQIMSEGDRARGYFVEPTLVEAPLSHPLWQEEMFLPILMVHRVKNNDEAMRLANDSRLGLTAGVFGTPDEVEWFFDQIEAGVCYANRPLGCTTGAWPGYQPFGGWKGSGNTGKAIASFYYLAQYLREQSQTVVD